MAYESNSIFWVDIDKVVPNPYQPRKEFNQQALQDLADSIRMYGILQPLTVIRKEVNLDNGAFRTEYELVAGERRLRASKIAGLSQVPVIIRSGEETELMKLELAIIENLQREDLNPIDRALAFRQLANAFGISHGQIAKKVGRSREYVSNSIRLLLLPDTIMSAVSQGEISDGHARTLLMLNDKPEEQDVVFREILLKKLSVREVERIARKIAQDKIRKKSWQDADADTIAIEKQLTDSLGTRVQISKTEYGGKVVIDYFSGEDLQKLITLFEMRTDDSYLVRGEYGALEHDELRAIEQATGIEPVEALPVVREISQPERMEVINYEPVSNDVPEEQEEVRPLFSHANEGISDSFRDIVPVPEIPSSPISNQEENIPVTFPHESSFVHEEELNAPAIFVALQNEKPKPAKDESDDDLYSIKNFSL